MANNLKERLHKKIGMKHINIIAAVILLFFASCSNQGKNNSGETKPKDSTAVSGTDTSVKADGIITPGSGTGNNASGTSNAGVNGTDTAAIGTNHSVGRDSTGKNKKHQK